MHAYQLELIICFRCHRTLPIISVVMTETRKYIRRTPEMLHVVLTHSYQIELNFCLHWQSESSYQECRQHWQRHAGTWERQHSRQKQKYAEGLKCSMLTHSYQIELIICLQWQSDSSYQKCRHHRGTQSNENDSTVDKTYKLKPWNVARRCTPIR